MAATASKLIALPGGTFGIDASLMAPEDQRYLEMVTPTFLVEHPKGLVLFDTGYSWKMAEDFDAYMEELSKLKLIVDHRPFTRDLVVDRQLKHHGYDPASITHVVVSHGHYDHAGAVGLFPDAQIFAIAGEMRYAAWPDARHVHLGFKSTDIAATRGFKWTEPDADHDLLGDGSIVILKTPGHTPGECSLKVRLKNETVMLTGDTLHLRIQVKTLKGMGGDYNPQQAGESVKRVVDIAKAEDARIWVNHDPDDWAEYPHEIK
ncbi:MAG: N-acyl homoserine lactonase family protein [Candidatus Binataceae bacterium]